MKPHWLLLAAVLAASTAFTSFHASAQNARDAKPSGTMIEFSIDASRSLPNDLARATAYAEATDVNSAELAKRVNANIAAAIALAKTYSTVKIQTGTSHSYPNYYKTGRSIESWRMRSELLLESRDTAALSELLGKLQANLGVSKISQQVSPQARRKAEEDIIVDAMSAFQERAQRIAAAVKKNYRIKQININNSRSPVIPIMRATTAMAETAPMPIEAGENQISVTLTGQIELTE